MDIEANIAQIISEIPRHVRLLAVLKGRQPDEIEHAIHAGITLIGENYVQEAERHFEVVKQVERHFIGRLQKNKVKKAVQLFDLIETVDSISLAREINGRAAQISKAMPVFVELNIGREPQKSGVMPDDLVALLKEISLLPNIRVKGIMVIEPAGAKPEDARPYFCETRLVFDRLKGLDLPGVEMKHLSMGMSSTYRIAIEEGATIVRIGTRIFGERPSG